MASWIGCDLDGCLAKHGKNWPARPPWKIGEPIPAMVEIVKRHISEGETVKVFTARIIEAEKAAGAWGRDAEIINIWHWTREHIGTALDSTSTKDFGMKFFYDDRGIWVQQDEGIVWTPERIALLKETA